jgi:hypothetical protein
MGESTELPGLDPTVSFRDSIVFPWTLVAIRLFMVWNTVQLSWVYSRLLALIESWACHRFKTLRACSKHTSVGGREAARSGLLTCWPIVLAIQLRHRYGDEPRGR